MKHFVLYGKPFCFYFISEQISEHVTLIPFKPHSFWRSNQTDNKYGPNLSFSVQVHCDENYGGSACGHYCVPRNDYILGHNDCDEDKRRVCHDGWKGEFCTIGRIVYSFIILLTVICSFPSFESQ
jgi:Delta serrate ligand.